MCQVSAAGCTAETGALQGHVLGTLLSSRLRMLHVVHHGDITEVTAC